MKNIKSSKLRKIILLCLAIPNAQFLWGQDSIRLHDDILMKTVTENPYLAFRFPVPEYTLTNLSYQREQYDFSRKQVPSKAANVHFKTQGILKLSENIILSGKIGFNKIDEKSVSYVLDNKRTTEQFAIAAPYYYVARPADWKKQNYQLEGTIAYRLTKNLVAQASAKGDYSENTRNLDARPEVKSVNYDVGGKLGYSIGNHTLAAGGGYQNFDKSLDIYYAESLLNNAIVYPDTFLRLNEGYGNNYIARSSRMTHLYKNIGNYFTAEYAYTLPSTLLRVGYRNGYNFTTIYNDFHQNPFKKLMALKRNEDLVFADFQTQWNNQFWTSQLEYRQYETLNYNYTSKASSNKQTEQVFKLKNRYNITHKNTSTYYGLDIGVGRFRTQDLSVILDKSIVYGQLDVTFGKEFPLSNTRKLGFNTTQSLYLPLNETFNYQPYLSSQENVFIVNIAKPDHFYDTSVRYSPRMELFYHQKSDKLNWEVYVTSQQLFFAGNKTDFTGNKGSNFLWQTGIRIFY